ncbi:MAG: T9SS type A sorting domain-containing protein [Saprospiraceae bacterium]|nr:T9SS type A sorting domain-containing protein [Saprospiraceae bacterium]
MIKIRFISTIFCFFIIIYSAFSQELRLAHFFPDELVRRIRMPNAEERFISSSVRSRAIKVYLGNYNLLRIFDYSSLTNNEPLSVFNTYINEIGSDTLMKFQYYANRKRGFRREDGQILSEISTDTIWRYYLSEVNGLKTKLVGVYSVDKKYNYCLFDTLNLGLKGCISERNFIRANCNGFGERFITTKFTDVSKVQQNALVLNENFDTLAKFRLPDKAINSFISHDFGLGIVPMFGVSSSSNPGEPRYSMFKMFDLEGNQRFSDSITNTTNYTLYTHLGKWLGKYDVTWNQNIADTTYSLLSLTDFRIVHQFKKITNVQAVTFGKAGEKILAYNGLGDTIYIYNQDFSLFKKIPVIPSFKAYMLNHISDNLLNNDDEFELFYIKSDFWAVTSELRIANSQGKIMLSTPNYSSYDISQIPGMKNKLVVTAENSTSVYELETETISSVSNSTLLHPVVFPNPFSDNLTVKINSNEEMYPLSIRLFDMLGKEQRTWQMKENEFQINLSDMPKSIYFLEISNGQHRAVKKIVKQ